MISLMPPKARRVVTLGMPQGRGGLVMGNNCFRIDI
jgi:hypothetical protein